ncbi:putative Aldehyde dehydrogenase family 7 member B4 [Cardiosporidium cionae]|uniref:aldehyde dehydrogenase (NAD(+)) n=1 Tax=Cardiosporidium cionae TaxID=476202 RepID=A0ABQ7JD28_9APIC|nr:putative Aldehyde dehydrogenase family 7 member B4 [Cardiosporidium cionae]|eukprot:KAF8821530.1 putative Aldehyde dehydrogenase family 7 member B4 [Cardiosporidium cionae]
MASSHYDFSQFGLKQDPAKNTLVCAEGNTFATSGVSSTDNVLSFTSTNPSNNTALGTVYVAANSSNRLEEVICRAQAAAPIWASTTTPARAEFIRKLGNKLRLHLPALGDLLSQEVGKINSEALGEIQEFIDICDYAAGLGRTIDGKVLPSERPGHVLIERWHPLGIVGIISAFNFPVAVFGWNAAIAFICGNCVIWKPSPRTPLISVAIAHLIAEVLREENLPQGLFHCLVGPNELGELMSKDSRIPLISFTGSTTVGRLVSKWVNERFGKILLELGGNSASIIMPDADLDLAVKGSAFAAVGTAGQRCTSLRRLIIHSSIYTKVVERLIKAYDNVVIGSAANPETLCGPLQSAEARDNFLKEIKQIKSLGGKILCGGVAATNVGDGFFVKPTIVEIDSDAPILKKEIFAPILYVLKFSTLDEAIKINNSVPQGLSSSIYTKNIGNVFSWIGPLGSDCGLVNVNVGPSGAEIGGAFGGEKETGGGRESGSDAWKQYMRRITVTINFSDSLPLAQGVEFDV